MTRERTAAGSLGMVRDLICEAKGADGPKGGFVTDHLDAAENSLNRVEAAYDDMLASLKAIAQRISDNGSWTLDDACRETAWIQAEARLAISRAESTALSGQT